MAKSKHHNVPISMRGHDRKENIICLEDEDHNQIHSTQNVDPGVIRTFYKKTNHLSTDSDEYKRYRQKLLLQYFAGACMLPVRLVNVQAKALKKLVLALCAEKGIEPPKEIGETSPTVQLLYWASQVALLSIEFGWIYITIY